MLDVTCAIILVGNKILVTQRSEKMNLPLKWEFPGGKLEVGESEIDCVQREIKEELNIEIAIIKKLTPRIHTYNGFQINLIPFIAQYVSGAIQLAEHKDYLLMDSDKLTDLDWAEADIPIVNEFLEGNYLNHS